MGKGWEVFLAALIFVLFKDGFSKIIECPDKCTQGEYYAANSDGSACTCATCSTICGDDPSSITPDCRTKCPRFVEYLNKYMGANINETTPRQYTTTPLQQTTTPLIQTTTPRPQTATPELGRKVTGKVDDCTEKLNHVKNDCESGIVCVIIGALLVVIIMGVLIKFVLGTVFHKVGYSYLLAKNLKDTPQGRRLSGEIDVEASSATIDSSMSLGNTSSDGSRSAAGQNPNGASSSSCPSDGLEGPVEGPPGHRASCGGEEEQRSMEHCKSGTDLKQRISTTGQTTDSDNTIHREQPGVVKQTNKVAPFNRSSEPRHENDGRQGAVPRQNRRSANTLSPVQSDISHTSSALDQNSIRDSVPQQTVRERPAAHEQTPASSQTNLQISGKYAIPDPFGNTEDETEYVNSGDPLLPPRTDNRESSALSVSNHVNRNVSGNVEADRDSSSASTPLLEAQENSSISLPKYVTPSFGDASEPPANLDSTHGLVGLASNASSQSVSRKDERLINNPAIPEQQLRTNSLADIQSNTSEGRTARDHNDLQTFQAGGRGLPTEDSVNRATGLSSNPTSYYGGREPATHASVYQANDVSSNPASYPVSGNYDGHSQASEATTSETKPKTLQPWPIGGREPDTHASVYQANDVSSNPASYPVSGNYADRSIRGPAAPQSEVNSLNSRSSETDSTKDRQNEGGSQVVAPGAGRGAGSGKVSGAESFERSGARPDATFGAGSGGGRGTGSVAGCGAGADEIHQEQANHTPGAQRPAGAEINYLGRNRSRFQPQSQQTSLGTEGSRISITNNPVQPPDGQNNHTVSDEQQLQMELQ